MYNSGGTLLLLRLVRSQRLAPSFCASARSILRARTQPRNFPVCCGQRLVTMASSDRAGKRPARDASISPPPVKRKAQSAISQAAVKSFFTPTSQKPKDRTVWTERAPPDHGESDDEGPATLLVAKYKPEGVATEDEPPSKRRKIAAFDLDSTLIKTSSGRKHADGPGDWQWWDRSVPGKLKSLYNDEGYQLVIFSNQGGLKLHPDPKARTPKNIKSRVDHFKQKCASVLSQLDLPLTLYAATAKDIFRKPRTGMWQEMRDDYGLSDADIDLEHSIFVGDAGGRTTQLAAAASGARAIPKDFSCSDRNMAHNIGIKYQTPEEFFLGEEPREFVRDFDLVHHPFNEAAAQGSVETKVIEKTNDKDIIMFCGPPGAGKSTFYWKHLKPLGYERVNQDKLKTKEKCLSVAADLLEDGASVAVDNTNADPDTRAQWVKLAAKHGVPIRCVWFRTPLLVAQHNDAVRSMNDALNPESRSILPQLAFNGFNARFKEPQVKEGFQDVVEVEFAFRGTKEEYAIWAKYWL